MGIPCVRDRVAQTAAILVLSPIFEADLRPEQYAYRPGRSALDAVRQWLCRKHKVRTGNHARFSDERLWHAYGLTRLVPRTTGFPWGKGMISSESRMREICTSGSMSGVWKRGRVRLLRHRPTKGPETDRPSLNHRATSRLYPNIKVDRRPDLDEIYMAAVHAMTGSGGWPMTVFLRPDLRPFCGGTYYPPEDRHGRPGLPRVLAAVADYYRNHRDRIEQPAGRLLAVLSGRAICPVLLKVQDPGLPRPGSCFRAVPPDLRRGVRRLWKRPEIPQQHGASQLLRIHRATFKRCGKREKATLPFH